MGRKKKDLIGVRFGRLVVLERAENNGRNGKNARWKCRCDCGNVCVVNNGDISSGHTKSCGCIKREVNASRLTTHGETHTRLHGIWRGIKDRCYRSAEKSYVNYGGRGIKMCDEWFKSFTAFRDWALSNGYEDDLSIERIDNDGNYEPNNCKWATRLEQADNRRDTIHVYIDGEKANLQELSRVTGIYPTTIYKRYREGARGLELIRKPVRGYRRIDNQQHKKTRI